jgi:hypothetical protein
MTGWMRFWFREVPPHVFALMRILFGLLGCAMVLALSDVDAYWLPGGLVTGEALGLEERLHIGWGQLAGRLLFAGTLLAFVATTVGFRSRLTVALAFVATVLHATWNSLPLSAAHEVHRSVLFALMWADCGAVWSVDAWLAGRRTRAAPGFDAVQPQWPLRIIQFQIALIYLNSGLWKLSSPLWRHGETLHYVLNSNVFRRYPAGLPASLVPAAMVMTYVVLAWELAFAPMMLFRFTRRVALATGVVLHLGMWTVLELGPFSHVMLASYCAFLDPVAFARCSERKAGTRGAPRSRPLFFARLRQSAGSDESGTAP